MEGLRKSRVKSMAEAFELMDKKGEGAISKEDFRDIFKNLGIGNKIDPNELEKFIDHFWTNKTAAIDY